MRFPLSCLAALLASPVPRGAWSRAARVPSPAAKANLARRGQDPGASGAMTKTGTARDSRSARRREAPRPVHTHPPYRRPLHPLAGRPQGARASVQASSRFERRRLRQAWVGNPDFARELANRRDPRPTRLAPTSRSTSVPGTGWTGRSPSSAPATPGGGGYYPEDMTAGIRGLWVKAHPGDKERFTSTVTVIRRHPGIQGSGRDSPTHRSNRAWLEPPPGSSRRPPRRPTTNPEAS